MAQIEKLNKEENKSLKNIKNKNLNQKLELKEILIDEIDILSKYFKKISNNLSLISDNLNINQKSNSKEIILNNNTLNNIKEAIQSINNKEYFTLISNCLNEIIKTFDIKYYHNGIIEENIREQNKNEFLGNKRNKKEIEEEVNKDVLTKIRKFRNNSGIIIGYYIKIYYFDNIFKLGPWKNLNFVANLNNIFIKKLNELELDDNNKKKLIDKFLMKFKNKVYNKYPPLKF